MHRQLMLGLCAACALSACAAETAQSTGLDGKADDLDGESLSVIAWLAQNSPEPGTYRGRGPGNLWDCTATVDYDDSTYFAEVATDQFTSQFYLTDTMRVVDYSVIDHADYHFFTVEVDDEEESVPARLTLENYSAGGVGVLVGIREEPDRMSYRPCYFADAGE